MQDIAQIQVDDPDIEMREDNIMTQFNEKFSTLVEVATTKS